MRPSRGGTRAPWAIGVLAAAFIGLALARSTRIGVRAERSAMYALGGRRAEWSAIAQVLQCLPWLAGVAGLLVLISCVLAQEMRSLIALVVFTVANLGNVVVKWGLMRLLGPGSATLPSGHATFALTAAVVLVMCRPLGRHDEVVGGAAAFGATVGSVGVVAAYWHRPGDVMASGLLVALCLLGAEACTPRSRRCSQGAGGPRYVGRHRYRSHRPEGLWYVGRHRPRSAAAPVAVLPMALGAAIAVTTVLGWGFAPQTTSVGVWLLGVADLLVLSAAAVVVVSLAVRVAARASRVTH